MQIENKEPMILVVPFFFFYKPVNFVHPHLAKPLIDIIAIKTKTAFDAKQRVKNYNDDG